MSCPAHSSSPARHPPPPPLISPVQRCAAQNVRAVGLMQDGYLREDSLIIPYLNRAADLLFILARYQDRRLPTELLTGER